MDASKPGTSDGRQKILLVVNDPDIARLLHFKLEQEGFVIVAAVHGESPLDAARRTRPALIILDSSLEAAAAHDVVVTLEKDPETARLPMVVLTEENQQGHVSAETAAAAYIAKPFSSRELVSRVRTVLRRVYGPEPERPHEVYAKGRLRIDFGSYEVFLNEKRIHLSLRDFELLRFFVSSPNRVFDRSVILKLVWGQDTHVAPRTVDVHVRRLRARIERDDAHPELIVTVRGVGYRFNDRALDS